MHINLAFTMFRMLLTVVHFLESVEDHCSQHGTDTERITRLGFYSQLNFSGLHFFLIFKMKSLKICFVRTLQLPNSMIP